MQKTLYCDGKPIFPVFSITWSEQKSEIKVEVSGLIGDFRIFFGNPRRLLPRLSFRVPLVVLITFQKVSILCGFRKIRKKINVFSDCRLKFRKNKKNGRKLIRPLSDKCKVQLCRE